MGEFSSLRGVARYVVEYVNYDYDYYDDYYYDYDYYRYYYYYYYYYYAYICRPTDVTPPLAGTSHRSWRVTVQRTVRVPCPATLNDWSGD